MSGKRATTFKTKPPLVLVADDDKVMRIMLRDFMEKEGYRVIDVQDGQECLEAFHHSKPDLILLDAVMPNVDGFACCKNLLQIARNNLAIALANFDDSTSFGTTIISKLWERTPILMITGLDDQESVDKAFEVGASDYVTKPINWAVLRQRVRRLLQQAQLYKQLEAANQALQQMANMDGLTGVANRRRFDQYLNSQWMSLAQERNMDKGSKPTFLSMILCDIDYFKRYNDKYGHPAGDNCLQKVATIISGAVTNNQHLVARYGGEEFAVVMPLTNPAKAVQIAASMQAGVREMEILHDGSSVSQFVTLSMGVATAVPDFNSSLEDLIKTADNGLYQAKAEGRNRIILKHVGCD